MKTSTQSGQYDNKRNFEVKTGTQKKIPMALYKSMLHEELDCLLSVPPSIKKKNYSKTWKRTEKHNKNDQRCGRCYIQAATKWLGDFRMEKRWLQRYVRNIRKKKMQQNCFREKKYGTNVHGFLSYKT